MSVPRTPHGYITSRFEHQLEMVRPSQEPVIVPPSPRGYTMRTFRDGDEQAYEELFRLAWSDVGTLPHTRAHALAGGFVLVEHDESAQLVASGVAFEPESPRHADDGSLGWLVVDPAHGRRGLGTIVAGTVTNRLIDAWYLLPWLGTEDDRLAAIAMYLRLGWQPHLYEESMESRWHDIFARLPEEFRLSGGA